MHAQHNVRREPEARLESLIRGHAEPFHQRCPPPLTPRRYVGLYKKSGERHPCCAWFWEVVAGYNHEERARLLQFSTGSARLPAQGFKVSGRGSTAPPPEPPRKERGRERGEKEGHVRVWGAA